MEQDPEDFLKAQFVIFRCQKYAKKGYIEVRKWIYLVPLKSLLGRSILHYLYYFGFRINVWFLMIENFQQLSQYFFMKLTLYPGHLSFLISDGGECVSFVPWSCPISERWNAPGTRLSSTTWRFYKTCASQNMMFPFILRISFVNLNQSAKDSCRFDIINKINF